MLPVPQMRTILRKVHKGRNDGKKHSFPKVRPFTNLAGTRRPMKVVTMRNNGVNRLGQANSPDGRPPKRSAARGSAPAWMTLADAPGKDAPRVVAPATQPLGQAGVSRSSRPT